ncbi:hypothetical protein HPB49_007698 [Dermacentor silvarum]|uniref:Uncharacterized protein n=1 Tax=Dermacentor silvarum TaxID=543639 RepID=A0ACB8DXC6_DERSI|nr:hypothetical protein HPB49_007698 [Dermacentor silvarum]
MTAITCLVTVGINGARRKMRLAEEPNWRALKASASVCSLLAAEINFDTDRFQIFDQDFNDFVDLLDEDPIPDMAVLRVVKPAHQAEAFIEEEPTLYDAEISAGALERSFNVATSQEDDDGMGFALPDLHFLNGVVKENIPLTSYITTRIVDSLFQEMTAHTMYPSHKFYQGTTSTLVRRYPELADPCGSGHAQGLVSSGEDSCSLAQHEAWLVSESKKANPDRPQMLCRLQLTHTARAKDLFQMSPVEAMEKYPYLADKEWFLEDFNILIKKDGTKSVGNGFEKTQCLAMRGVLGAKKKDITHIIEAHTVNGSTRRRKHIRAVRVLQLLSNVLNEPKALDSMFVHVDEDKPCTPCIVYTGTTLEAADELFLFAEKKQLARVIDAEEGTTAMMAAYWAFDFSYAKPAYNLSCVLEHLFLHYLDLVECYNVEYMHRVLVWVTRQFTEYWFDSARGDEKFYIGLFGLFGVLFTAADHLHRADHGSCPQELAFDHAPPFSVWKAKTAHSVRTTAVARVHQLPRNIWAHDDVNGI